MPVNNVNGSSPYTSAYGVTGAGAKPATKAEEAAEQVETKAKEDGFVKTGPQQAVTYKPDMNKVNEMKASLGNNISAFQSMVQGLFGKQIDFSQNVMQQLAGITGNANWEDDGSFDNDPNWGVEAVATRILDFAKALAGGDESKIATLRDAVEKGFKAAGAAWGGKMPSITDKTYNRTMELFDEWESGGDKAVAE